MHYIRSTVAGLDGLVWWIAICSIGTLRPRQRVRPWHWRRRRSGRRARSSEPAERAWDRAERTTSETTHVHKDDGRWAELASLQFDDDVWVTSLQGLLFTLVDVRAWCVDRWSYCLYKWNAHCRRGWLAWQRAVGPVTRRPMLPCIAVVSYHPHVWAREAPAHDRASDRCSAGTLYNGGGSSMLCHPRPVLSALIAILFPWNHSGRLRWSRWMKNNAIFRHHMCSSRLVWERRECDYYRPGSCRCTGEKTEPSKSFSWKCIRFDWIWTLGLGFLLAYLPVLPQWLIANNYIYLSHTLFHSNT